jgi:hypothetical protein
MTTVVLTKPRTLNHAAAMRIINSARTDWRTWLAASLFPFKLYVALALIAVFYLKAISVDEDFGFGASYNLTTVFIAAGYFLCLLVLTIGALVQAAVRSDRAALNSAWFALAALIIGLGACVFASQIRVYEAFPDRATVFLSSPHTARCAQNSKSFC